MLETSEHPFSVSRADAFGESAAQRFLNDGFCRVDQVIDAEELASLREIYDWCFSAAADGKVRRKALGGVDEQGRQALPQVLEPSQAVPELACLAFRRRVTEIARAVFKTDVIFRADHMILKPAGYGTATPWHQDQAYHDPSNRYRNINFWLPLDGATVEGGCMKFVPGSHLGPILPHEHLDPADRQTALVAQGQAYWSLNSIAVPCPEGSCSLHHSYTLHYAGPNRTDRPRRAYILVIGCPPLPAPHPWQLPWQPRESQAGRA
jgi:ectoine hydroxylase-related dioxygenase (phytanoyl-CoA dioxygenase family)